MRQSYHALTPIITLCAWVFVCMSATATAANPLLYDYGNASPRAVELYRQGWSEILERGRWTEAERLYREALEADPDFVIAKSVLARMTVDPKERDILRADIERSQGEVDDWGRLILDPYAMTLTLIAARDSGGELKDGFRGELTDMAVVNYREFIDRYPSEWAVRIEYIEWIHAKHGPAEALKAIHEMAVEDSAFTARLSYFPAYFYAEVGDFERATAAAKKFVSDLGPGDWPQKHYIAAFIAYEQGDYPHAAEAIDQALRLDPRHIIAQRLRAKISTALGEGNATED